MKQQEAKKRISESGGLEVEFTLSPNQRHRGKKKTSKPEVEPGSIPRVTRLMALAIKFDGMIARGEVRDYADIARLGYVSRARITQIMNLTNLATDIQEEILFLPRRVKGHDPIREQNLRPIAQEMNWRDQRKLWKRLRFEKSGT